MTTRAALQKEGIGTRISQGLKMALFWVTLIVLGCIYSSEPQLETFEV